MAHKSCWTYLCAALIIGSALVRAQNEDCPEPDGFFADSEQCDRYYECVDGALTEHLCPDGLVYADLGNHIFKCDFPFNVKCEDRPALQKPQPSANCPRRNGYFAHPDPTVCDQFHFCSDGQFNLVTCPTGLVFDLKSGTCSWPGEANRTGCSSKDVVQFDCPPPVPNDPSGITNPLYPDPTDCQYFYVCINGVEARRNGCSLGQVYNDATKRCDKPKNVPECKDWYKNSGAEEEDEEEEEVTVTPKPKSSKRRPQQQE